jgi:predicted transcriptional regulator of viral defense system
MEYYPMNILLKPKPTSLQKAQVIFRNSGGIMRTAEAIRAGIHPRTLYAMRDCGELEFMGRGLYRLTDQPQMGNPDLLAIAKRIPNGVLCLISALSFHGITTQIPHEVYVALCRGKSRPRIEYPPVRIFWFSGNAFCEGIETHIIDSVPLQVYGPEKSLADIFRYRNSLGMETALEALHLYRQRGRINIEMLLRCARADRMEGVMRPYIEAVL